MKTRVVEVSSGSLGKIKKLREAGIWLVKIKYPFSKEPTFTFYRGTQSVPSSSEVVQELKELIKKVEEEVSEQSKKAALMEIELRRKGKEDEGVVARTYAFVFDLASESDVPPKILEETFLLKPKE